MVRGYGARRTARLISKSLAPKPPQCKAITKEGTQCTKPAKYQGFCGTHLKMPLQDNTPSHSPPTDKSGCFIATAVYGTPMAEEIIILRQWRDGFLINSKFGLKFINYYYRISPFIADSISKSSHLKAIIRLFINPIVKIIKKLY